jgi:hypothetical protein
MNSDEGKLNRGQLKERGWTPSLTEALLPPPSVSSTMILICSQRFLALTERRSARNSAQNYYPRGVHGLAGSSRRRKQKLYELKDRGIIAAHLAARLKCVAHHDALFLWQGEAYAFHSTLKPTEVDMPELALREGQKHLFVEATREGAEADRRGTCAGGAACGPLALRAGTLPRAAKGGRIRAHLLELWRIWPRCGRLPAKRIRKKLLEAPELKGRRKQNEECKSQDCN